MDDIQENISDDTWKFAFHLDPSMLRGPWWRPVLNIASAGALIGPIFWLLMDGNIFWHRILLWSAGGAAVCVIVLIPELRKAISPHPSPFPTAARCPERELSLE